MPVMERNQDPPPYVWMIAVLEDTTGQFDLRNQPLSEALKTCQIWGLEISSASYRAPLRHAPCNNFRHPKVY